MGGTSSDAGLSLTLDSAANVYTIGWFGGTVDFDPGIPTYNLSSAGQEDVFITKLDSSGAFKWAERMGGRYGDMGFDVVVDLTGNVYSIGYFEGEGNFSLDMQTSFNLTSSGSHDAFVKKYNSFVAIPKESTFYTYPNPCKNLISLALTKSVTNSTLRIFNLLGQVVIEKEEFNCNSCVVDLADLPTGVYFIAVCDLDVTYRSFFIKE